MMKKWGWLVGLFLLVSLSACCTFKYHQEGLQTQTKKIIDIGDIRNVVATGPFHLHVVIGHRKNQIVLQGTDEAIKCAKLTERNGTLYIKNVYDFQMDLYLNYVQSIKLRQLQMANIETSYKTRTELTAENVTNLRLTGKFFIPQLIILGNTNLTSKASLEIGSILANNDGKIILDRLQGQTELLRVEGNGKFILRGYVNIEKIEQTGGTMVDLYWLNSRATKIVISQNGVMKLSGKTFKLNVTLDDEAKLNARYLRSNIVMIKTNDQAEAVISSLHQLFAYATGRSLIKFYGNPTYFYNHLVDEGLVLRME